MSDPYRDALRKDARVKEYQILRVLGQGGFGITYLAFDLNLDGPIALKEYFPKEYAVRSADGHVSAASAASAENFDWGRQRFLDEARAINRFRHPNVVRAHRFFQSGGSVYIVMDYIEGESLDTILEKRSKLSPAEWRPLLDRLLDGLEHVHQHDYLHRDIKPGNIMIRDNDGEPVFIDFGSARLDTGDRTHTQVLTPGYAPLEQLGSGQQEGPPTDLYALAVVSYRALLGELPPGAPDRAIEDTIARLEQQVTGAERSWLAALDRCLAVYPNDRPQSVIAVREGFRVRRAATDSPEVKKYRSRFQLPKSGRGMTLVEELPPPFSAWEVRRWVGRRSSGVLQAAVFAPTYRHRRLRDGESVIVPVKGESSLQLYKWDPYRADDSPLWEKEFDNEREAFAGLFEQEESGAIEKAARERLEHDLVLQGQGQRSKRGVPSSDRSGTRNPARPRPNPTKSVPFMKSTGTVAGTSLIGVSRTPEPGAANEPGSAISAPGPPALTSHPHPRRPGRFVVWCWYLSIVVAMILDAGRDGTLWILGLIAALAGGVSVVAAFESEKLRGGIMLGVCAALLALFFFAIREESAGALTAWYLGGGIALWWVGTEFAWKIPTGKNVD